MSDITFPTQSSISKLKNSGSNSSQQCRNSIIPEVKNYRNATHKDIPQIQNLLNDILKEFYEPISFEDLVELSIYAYVTENEDGKIISFVCFNNYPYISALLPEIWMEWLSYHYNLNTIKYSNTLFIHYFIWDFRYDDDFLKPILKDLYLNEPKLEHICYVLPPTQYDVDYIGAYLTQLSFTKIIPTKNYKIKTTQAIYVNLRSSIGTKLKIRKAVPEDNDELVDILHSNCPQLKKYYGDFYIAEIIQKNENNRKIIVAEDTDQLVAMMCLNSKVDVTKLNKNFELQPFHCLRKNIATAEMKNRITVNNILRRESEIYIQKNGFDVVNEIVEDDLLNVNNFGTQENFTKIFDPQNENFLKKENSLTSIESSKSEFNEETFTEWEGTLPNLLSWNNYYKMESKDINELNSAPNVFAIELYGITSKTDERLAYNLLQAAFETFPNEEYCLISFPTATDMPQIVNYFKRVPPRSECSLNHSLFIVHRNNILSHLRVTRVASKDIKDIEKLIKYGQLDQIPPADDMMFMIYGCLYSETGIFDTLMIRSEKVPVGFVIVGSTENVELLRTNYDIDYYTNFKVQHCSNYHGTIHYFYLSPIFEIESAFLYREICRLTGYKSLYYSFRSSNKFGLYNTLLPTMYPIRPRRLISFDKNEDFSDIDQSHIPYFGYWEPFALYYQNLKLSTQRRKNIEFKIVIIGFGKTSQSFLETLIYSYEFKDIVFTNLTVIIPPGTFESDISDVKKLHLLFPYAHSYSAHYLRQLEMRAWVNFIAGFMTKIDRNTKYVIIDGAQKVRYDELYLFCGVQFDMPVEVGQIENYPKNLVLINKILDARIMYYKLQFIKQKLKKGYNIIVYGNSAKAFAGINYLLNEGIKGKNIHFIVPFSSKYDEFSIPIFNDDFIERKMDETLHKLNVHVYKDYKFVNWTLDRNGMIKTLTFESKHQFIQLPCTLFFCYNRKAVNVITVKALNESGLVFDGRVVIDSKCRTNDHNIYAAGTFTKYKRILFADKYRHMYYSSEEIGENLAKNFVKNINISSSEDQIFKDDLRDQFPMTVVVYKNPLISKFILPGNYYYLRIKSSGRQLPHFIWKQMGSYGTDYITLGEKSGNNENNLRYFRLHLDDNNHVKTIVCLSYKKFDPNRIIPMWGKHEKLLNNLKRTYESGKIKDFFEYFTQRWAIALCHDRFNHLQKLNLNIMKTLQYENDNHSGRENFKKALKERYYKLSASTRNKIIQYFQSDEYIEVLRQNLLNFIGDNKETLFMYATALPDIPAN